MKPYFALIAGFFAAMPLAQAQVVINQAALAQLAGVPPVVITAPPEIRQAPRKISYRVPHRHKMVPEPATHVAAMPAISKPVIAPPAAAPQPVAPPVQPVVARPVVPPPPAHAAIRFGAGVADLPAGIAAQLQPFCAHPPAGPITIDAYAAADKSDPSAAPRLSMSRAFALRDALTACGVPSARIIPRADGATTNNPDTAVISAP